LGIGYVAILRNFQFINLVIQANEELLDAGTAAYLFPIRPNLTEYSQQVV
jgi:hypothetical protein